MRPKALPRFPLRRDGKPLRPVTPLFEPGISRGSVAVGGTPGSPPPSPMILEYDTSLSSGEQIGFYLYDPVNVTIDWGDGNSEAATTSDTYLHTYSSEGTYTVNLTGTSLNGFDNTTGTPARSEKLLSIVSWGDLGLTSLYRTCALAINLDSVPSSIPSTVTSTYEMFASAYGFNHSNVASWNASNVTDMSYMFYEAYSFNQDLTGWDTSSVTAMKGMFNDAFNFAGDISTWDVTLVEDMSDMFDGATGFNSDISGWDTTSVTDMNNMFLGAYTFNRDIGGWNVSAVTTMSSMFNGATAFDGGIGGWDVSSVTVMSGMFQSASAFNQDLSGWCVSLIPSEPTNFATSTPSWSADKPVWGTCP